MIEWLRRDERGMSIAAAVLALTIISMIMLYVGTQALNSMYTVRKKTDRSVGMAAGDSAIEKYRVALQSGLADESNGYLLDRAGLQSLIRAQSGADVQPNSATSGASGMADVLPSVPAWARFTVRERGSDSIGHWQVFHIHQPRYLQSTPASDVVIYIRAWATATTSTNITTRPRVFRVEFRPGFFSDYQVVTDAPFHGRNFGSTMIDGPIHSNGYRYLDWLALDAANRPTTGIYLQGTLTCGPNARFSTSQNAPISIPGGSCGAAAGSARRDARQINLLGVEDTFRRLATRCGVGNGVVQCASGSSTYDVRLGAGSVRVNGRAYSLVNTGPDTAALALLLDGDVVLSGSVSSPGRAARVTIATRRTSNGARRPQVFLRNTGSSPVVGSADLRNSVGVITQGDVVIDGQTRYRCLRQVNLAAISSSGSVSITPEMLTIAPPAISLAGRDCGDLALNGSFSSHGQQVLSILWANPRVPGTSTLPVGYSRATLRYNRNLFLAPPPYFPIATPWGVTTSKDADTRCLQGPMSGDPQCE
jgi:type II secretory pathway pseudopilin PulG